MEQYPVAAEHSETFVDLDRTFVRALQQIAKAEERGFRGRLFIVSRIEADCIEEFLRNRPEGEVGIVGRFEKPWSYESRFFLYGYPTVASDLVGELSPWLV